MLRGEKARSKPDAGKEQSLIFEIAHDLGIGESPTGVDREFSIVGRGGFPIIPDSTASELSSAK